MSKKLSLLFVSILLCHSTLCFSIDLNEIQEKHLGFLPDATLEFSGSVTLFFADNSEAIKQTSNYEGQIKSGKLTSLTLDELNTWYDNLSKDVRKWDVQYTLMLSKYSQRRIMHYPKGTMSPWDSYYEIAFPDTRDNNLITIDHGYKFAKVSNKPENKIHYDFEHGFNYPIFVFPLIVLDKNDVQLSYINDDYVKITYVALSKRADRILKLESILDPKNNYMAKETLVIFDNEYKEQVVYLKIGDEKIAGPLPLPKTYIIDQWVQRKGSIQKQIDEAMELKGIKVNNEILPNSDEFIILNPETIVNIEQLQENNINHKWVRMEFTLKNITPKEENFNKMTFWPEVPKGYKYKDGRNELQYLYSKYKTLSDNDKKRVAGIGPYVFPEL